MKELPSLERTRQAIAIYDRADAMLTTEYILSLPTLECNTALRRLETLAEAVGIAFGEDTDDRNNADTCRRLIRPGNSDSFVRRMVRQWETQ